MVNNTKNYLITGATGFIGGRLVEKLCLENQSQVNALIRTPANAINIGRFPISMFPGDIMDYDSLNEAMENIDTVFHCAHYFAGDVEANRQATKHVLNAAINQQVKRIIVLSTADVYDTTNGNTINEQHPLKKTSNNSYVKSKLAVEGVCRDFFDKYQVPVVLIQPTVVYGPWCPAWTVRIFNLLQSGIFPLVDNGNGFCNTIYIDDLVDLIIRAGKQPGVEGETFIASNKQPLTWKEFFGHFEAILGEKRTIDLSMPPKQLSGSQFKSTLNKYKTQMHQILSPQIPRGLKEALKKWTAKFRDNDRIYPLTAEQITYFASRVIFDEAKAKKTLNFQPQFAYQEGFEHVKHWYQFYYKYWNTM